MSYKIFWQLIDRLSHFLLKYKYFLPLFDIYGFWIVGWKKKKQFEDVTSGSWGGCDEQFNNLCDIL